MDRQIFASGLGEGSGWKCHWNHHRKEEKGRGRVGGRWIRPACAGESVLLEATQSPEGLAPRAQPHSVLCKTLCRVGDFSQETSEPQCCCGFIKGASGHAHSSPGDGPSGHGAHRAMGSPCLLPASCCSSPHPPILVPPPEPEEKSRV